eukprot:2030390-Pyramimonas_sp.AAC.1
MNYGEGVVIATTYAAIGVGEHATYPAGHCSECARSSRGWVHLGDLIAKMETDGILHATTALAVHGLT